VVHHKRTSRTMDLVEQYFPKPRYLSIILFCSRRDWGCVVPCDAVFFCESRKCILWNPSTIASRNSNMTQGSSNINRDISVLYMVLETKEDQRTSKSVIRATIQCTNDFPWVTTLGIGGQDLCNQYTLVPSCNSTRLWV
jgi:hypothetical protein